MILGNEPMSLLGSTPMLSSPLEIPKRAAPSHRPQSAALYTAADYCKVSASLLTILLTIPDILKQDFVLSNTLYTYLIHFLRVLFEFFLIALWCAAFVTMLLPKGKDFRLLFHRPPYVQWDCAAVLAAIEL